MRIVVLSDSHGRENKVIDIVYKHKGADYFIHCGDGENDFDTAKILAPDIKIIQVRGNCDWRGDLPDEKFIELSGKKILISHGHKYQVKYSYNQYINKAKELNADICLFGHTHKPFLQYENGLYIFNPGSVAQEDYGIIDIQNNAVFCYHSTI